MEVCTVEDDNGNFCTNIMSAEEKQRDGMCERCAEALWADYYSPMMTGKPNRPFIFTNNFRSGHGHADDSQCIHGA